MDPCLQDTSNTITESVQESKLQFEIENVSNHCPEDDDLVCAICLESIAIADMALVKGCEHMYCVCCILQWAMCKEDSQCPQCKCSFDHLYVHRMVDGSLSDFPVQETLSSLKNARWFREHPKVLAKGITSSNRDYLNLQELGNHIGYEDDYGDDDDDYDYDDDYAGSSGSRIIVGNRRLGENGYMRAGRMYARPRHQQQQPPPPPVNHRKNGPDRIGKAGQKPADKAVPKSAAPRSPHIGGGSSSDAGGSSSAAELYGNSPPEVSFMPGTSGSCSVLSESSPRPGRRAKRAARRAAADLENEDE